MAPCHTKRLLGWLSHREEQDDDHHLLYRYRFLQEIIQHAMRVDFRYGTCTEAALDSPASTGIVTVARVTQILAGSAAR
ncbi:hypothetical protein SAMN05519104_7942 [Rhizobiales bacterium GAS188]|nr:hypothetical protein SAMN05519104_7942 [Rhizobiales bacterium GAS188]